MLALAGGQLKIPCSRYNFWAETFDSFLTQSFSTQSASNLSSLIYAPVCFLAAI